MYHSFGGSTDPDTQFSHLNTEGKANMVNVGGKTKMKRTALAQGRIFVGDEVIARICDQSMKKGDIISVSRIAGIMGAKKTSHLIPLCHQIPLDHISVDIVPSQQSGSLLVTAKVEARHHTGVEMESLTAVTITLLTLYDMCKSVNKSMIVSDIKLLSKMKE